MEAISYASLPHAPEKAIDNNPQTFFLSDIYLGENMKSIFLWLQLELQRYSQVERIHITNANTHTDTSNVETRVGNTRFLPYADSSWTFAQQKKDIDRNQVCYKYLYVVEAGKRLEMHCDKRLFGSFVSIHILDPQVASMKIAEVVVYGKSTKLFL